MSLYVSSLSMLVDWSSPIMYPTCFSFFSARFFIRFLTTFPYHYHENPYKKCSYYPKRRYTVNLKRIHIQAFYFEVGISKNIHETSYQFQALGSTAFIKLNWFSSSSQGLVFPSSRYSMTVDVTASVNEMHF